MSSVLITGAAGFIGSHLARALLARGERVIGVDNLNRFYDPRLKEKRLAWITEPGKGSFDFHRLELTDVDAIARLVETGEVDRLVHLGAQAGVRWSLEAPFVYTESNVTGHLSLLEAARRARGRIRHLVYASSSSVYGSRMNGPFRETDPVDRPTSLYAATKIADELMSGLYSRLFDLPVTGLRLFSVYGPWGRPDMAYWLFTEAILEGRPIELFNEGRMERDFTYIDDIVGGIIAVLDTPAAAGEHRLYNVGNSRPEPLMKMVTTLERLLDTEAVKVMKPMQSVDVPSTYADISAMQRDFNWAPATDLETGLARFVGWWHDYARVSEA